jgi:osmoprotectant transport system permease protein
VWLARRGGPVALAGVNAANIGRTLPSLAVLALVMPVLGTGFAPSLFALTLLALPPILINTYAGLRDVDADVVDAARGMGMTQEQILRRVELPIALPIIFAGLRTAAVQVISGAVLAAFIGGGGLGDYITAGIAMMSMHLLLVGAIPVTLLSIGADALFGVLQRRLTPEGLVA